MCIIVDTNKFSDFLDPGNEDMKPVRKWIEKNGKLAYSPTPELARELNNHQAMKNRIVEYRRVGKLKSVSITEVEKKQATLSDLKSNDSHIIALALAADVKLLISGDNALHQDFKNKISGGKIYQNRQHARLFRGFSCPERCR